MVDSVDASNWLKSISEQLAAEKSITIPELIIPENFFGNQHQTIVNGVIEILPKIKNFRVVLDDQAQTIDCHKYLIKPNRDDGSVVPGVWFRPKESGPPKIFIRHYPNHPQDFGLEIMIFSDGVCELPRGAVVNRTGRYTQEGSLNIEARRLDLPLGSFQIPGIKYSGDEILTVKALIEPLNSRIPIFPVHLKNEPNFDISVGLRANKNAYPNDLLRFTCLSKTNDVYMIHSERFMFNLPKEGYPLVAKMVEEYGGKLLEKNVKIGEQIQ